MKEARLFFTVNSDLFAKYTLGQYRIYVYTKGRGLQARGLRFSVLTAHQVVLHGNTSIHIYRYIVLL